MRQIKFRAWDVEAKRMYPVAFPSWNGMIETRDGDHTHPTFWLSDGGPEEQGILMQFTGLLDKNGKEIYEGDVCLVEKNGIVVNARVVFNHGAFVFKFNDISNWKLVNRGGPKTCEVIGNIYENPSLPTNP